MPDSTATLELRDPVYHDSSPFYVTGTRVEPTSLASKVTYQLSQDLPSMYGWGRGPWPNKENWFDREQLETAAEFAISERARMESEANTIARTLTGIPIIALQGDATSLYVYDGTTSWAWDGTALPPYDATSIVTNPYVDTGFDITDIEDAGQAEDPGTVHLASVTHDGTVYAIDSTEFTFTVDITHYDGTSIVVVSEVDFTVEGRYTLTYGVIDNQRITAYPVTRIVEVHPPPTAQVTDC